MEEILRVRQAEADLGPEAEPFFLQFSGAVLLLSFAAAQQHIAQGREKWQRVGFCAQARRSQEHTVQGHTMWGGVIYPEPVFAGLEMDASCSVLCIYLKVLGLER